MDEKTGTGVNSDKEKVKESQSQSQTVTKNGTPARHPLRVAGSGASHQRCSVKRIIGLCRLID